MFKERNVCITDKYLCMNRQLDDTKLSLVHRQQNLTSSRPSRQIVFRVKLAHRI